MGKQKKHPLFLSTIYFFQYIPMKKNVLQYFILAILLLVLGVMVVKMQKPTVKDPVGTTKAPEQQLVEDNGDADKDPFSNTVKFDATKINEANPFAKDMVVVYDAACAEAKEDACDLEKLNQFLYMDFQAPQDQIAYINNQHPEYEQFKTQYDFTVPSPILFLSEKKVNTMKESISSFKTQMETDKNEEQLKIATETLANFEKEFPKENLKNGFYPLSLSTWLIDEKNVCDKETDWKEHKTCALAYLITDPNCPAEDYEACRPTVKAQVEEVAGKRLLIKELTKDQAGEYLKHNTKGTYPFLIIKQQKDATPQYLTETMLLRNEMIGIDSETYYATPSFLATDWSDTSKACTLDEAKVAQESAKYMSCKETACAGKNSCQAEEKNKLTMYTMGYCPYCKPVMKRLGEFKDKHPEATIDIVHLVQPITTAPTSLADLQSLHGDTETTEGARQFCINKEYGESTLIKYFATRFADTNITDESNLDASYKAANVEATKIDACMKLPATAKALADRANEAYKRGVQGTPTFLINNKEIVMGGYDEMLQGYEANNK